VPNPILGAILRFNADKNPNKVNLGQGVYRDENCQAVLVLKRKGKRIRNS
jgi:aspartate/tyrosine/aromatic aminotransferase